MRLFVVDREEFCTVPGGATLLFCTVVVVGAAATGPFAAAAAEGFTFFCLADASCPGAPPEGLLARGFFKGGLSTAMANMEGGFVLPLLAWPWAGEVVAA